MQYFQSCRYFAEFYMCGTLLGGTYSADSVVIAIDGETTLLKSVIKTKGYTESDFEIVKFESDIFDNLKLSMNNVKTQIGKLMRLLVKKDTSKLLFANVSNVIGLIPDIFIRTIILNTDICIGQLDGYMNG